jgi:hypothetical protein
MINWRIILSFTTKYSNGNSFLLENPCFAWEGLANEEQTTSSNSQVTPKLYKAKTILKVIQFTQSRSMTCVPRRIFVTAQTDIRSGNESA